MAYIKKQSQYRTTKELPELYAENVDLRAKLTAHRHEAIKTERRLRQQISDLSHTIRSLRSRANDLEHLQRSNRGFADRGRDAGDGVGDHRAGSRE